jgi:hypothetical protein
MSFNGDFVGNLVRWNRRHAFALSFRDNESAIEVASMLKFISVIFMILRLVFGRMKLRVGGNQRF